MVIATQVVGRRRLRNACALAGVAALMSGAAHAQTRADSQPPAQPEIRTSFNVGAASNYVFRGLDQTAGRGQLMAGADASYGDLYAGAFTSNVNFTHLGDPRVDQELDLYGGWRTETLGYGLDVGLIYYGYLHQQRGAHDDYAEGSVRVSRSIGPVSASASLHYSPQFQQRTGSAVYADIGAGYEVNERVKLSGMLGRQTIARAPDYTTWNLGSEVTLTRHVSLDLRYWDTDRHSLGQPYRAKLVAGLRATF